MVYYQNYNYSSASYGVSDEDHNLGRMDELFVLYEQLDALRDANASTDSSSASTASSHPHGQYAGAPYPPTVNQIPLISVNGADAGIGHSYSTAIDPRLVSLGQNSSPLYSMEDVPFDLNFQELEEFAQSILYSAPIVPPSPAMMTTHQPPAPAPMPVSALVPAPRLNNSPRSRAPGRTLGPERIRQRESSSKAMSPAAASAVLRQQRDRNAPQLPACSNCKKSKTKCKPSASGDQCATCVTQKKECIRSNVQTRPPPPTVGALERKIRELFAKIEQQMHALNGGAVPFSGPNPTLSLNSKSCDCSADSHKPSCHVSDPALLCWRAKVMELLNDEDEDENENQDVEMGTSGGGSESDDQLSVSSLSLITPIPPSGTPVGMFFELAHQLGSPVNEQPPKGSPMTSSIGLAGADYFTPGPAAHPEIRRIMIEQGKLPSYLIKKTISPAECLELFDLFMKYWNVSVSVLDPGLHTAKYVLARFLAIAARNYHKDYYHLLMKEAKFLAGEAFVEGWKSVEKVQAFILLATFPAPARRHDEDRAWMYLGGAIRMAMDLDLNRVAEPFANERDERERLNRARTWLICHNLEVSCGAKTGKPITVQEDEMILSSKTWWQSSHYNMTYDIHLCAFTQICMIFNKYQAKLAPDSDARASYTTDVHALADQFTKEIQDFQLYFERLFAEESAHEDPACKYRAHVQYTAHYFRLVIYSHCYRQSSVQGMQPGDPILEHCIDAASQLVQALTDHHAHSMYFKFSAEGWFTFGAFAGAFMIKLLCPQAAPVIDHAQHQYLRALVMQLISAYSSPQVMIDKEHTPYIYAQFLSHLLARADELSGGVEEVMQAPKPDMDELFAALPSLHTISE